MKSTTTLIRIPRLVPLVLLGFGIYLLLSPALFLFGLPWIVPLIVAISIGAILAGLMWGSLRREVIARQTSDPRTVRMMWAVACFAGPLLAWTLFALKG